jgi:putative ATP-dependent endonuclease of the OLD family
VISKILVQNYKLFTDIELGLNENINILVGNNETGKSTILEAINLALTKKINGKLIDYELSPYCFNNIIVKKYLTAIHKGQNIIPPTIIIEVYFNDIESLARLKGTMNVKRENCPGIKLHIRFDENYKEEYHNLISHGEQIQQIPIEYYECIWRSFGDETLNYRALPFKSSYIDATSIRLQSGTDYYLQEILKGELDPKEKVELNIAYRRLKESFSREKFIVDINKKLSLKSEEISDKKLVINIDSTQKSNWETNLIPHLDDLPFHNIGKGDQNTLKIMMALEGKAKESNFILIEEPENHLSYSSMNRLLNKIESKCKDKQLFIATHSTYVLNKMGINNLIMLSKSVNGDNIESGKLERLEPDTYEYFMKLPGYDTLRILLSLKSILVEGPSDELIVQKAYYNTHNKLPLDDGIDIVNVRGLSFKRFLEIARLLNTNTIIITDNDGNYEENVISKYSEFKGCNNIHIFSSEDNRLKTLEYHIVELNELKLLNTVLKKKYSNTDALLKYMLNNKTEWALNVFESSELINLPKYILNAIKEK